MAPSSTPSPDDGAYSWGPRLWKHLPVGIANLLGSAHRGGNSLTPPDVVALPRTRAFAGVRGIDRRWPEGHRCSAVQPASTSGWRVATRWTRRSSSTAVPRHCDSPLSPSRRRAPRSSGAARLCAATTLPPRPSALAPRSPSTMSIPPRSAPIGPRSVRRSPPESMAVVLVHQYGIPVDLDRARALCDAHGAVVIEDAAQGAGAWWRHRRLGARGDLGILSFGRGKGMTAGGGGALLATGTAGQGTARRVPSACRPGWARRRQLGQAGSTGTAQPSDAVRSAGSHAVARPG